jgi:two-component system KDP operon response regulator KdpE
MMAAPIEIRSETTTLKRRILLVEDEGAFQQLLAIFLGALGYVVDNVADGQSAVHALEATRFDLVITDLCMPQYDGLELLTHLRKTQSRVPVIAMSGGSTSHKAGLLRAAELMGARVTLHKPFGLAELEAAVASVLAGVAGASGRPREGRDTP